MVDRGEGLPIIGVDPKPAKGSIAPSLLPSIHFRRGTGTMSEQCARYGTAFSVVTKSW
jgi:hypothetical protein